MERETTHPPIKEKKLSFSAVTANALAIEVADKNRGKRALLIAKLRRARRRERGAGDLDRGDVKGIWPEWRP